MNKADLFSDGGARGNPGPAGIGFAVLDASGTPICTGGSYIGETTNNVAEYKAFIWGLQNARALDISSLRVFADSELMVKQINGEYRVKNMVLKPLFLQAKELLSGFDSYEITHVRRELNKIADGLANEAMDCRGNVGTFVEPYSADSLF